MQNDPPRNAHRARPGNKTATLAFAARLVKLEIDEKSLNYIKKLSGFAACTLRGCISNKVQFVSSSNIRMVTQQEYESPEFRCEPMKAFRLVCNSCRCSDDGTTASWCTKKRCGAGE